MPVRPWRRSRQSVVGGFGRAGAQEGPHGTGPEPSPGGACSGFWLAPVLWDQGLVLINPGRRPADCWPSKLARPTPGGGPYRQIAPDSRSRAPEDRISIGVAEAPPGAQDPRPHHLPDHQRTIPVPSRTGIQRRLPGCPREGPARLRSRALRGLGPVDPLPPAVDRRRCETSG